MFSSYSLRIILFAAIVITSCGGPNIPDDVYVAYKKLPQTLDFNQHVKPILSDKCYLCHGPDAGNIKAGLQLHTAEKAFAELPESPGDVAIKPGNLNKSETFHRIVSDDPNLVMPQPESHLTLNSYEKAVLIKWIEDGAEYKDHWAFIKPQVDYIPGVQNPDLIANPIDNFVLSRLEQQGLSFSKKPIKNCS